MERKVQTQVLVHPDVRDMYRAFAVINGTTQAEMFRQGLTYAVAKLGRDHAADVRQIKAAASGMRVPFGRLVQRMMELGMRVDDLYYAPDEPYATLLLAERALETRRRGAAR